MGDRSNSRPIYRLERGTGEKDEKGEEGGGGQRRSDHSPKGMGKKREGGKGGRYKNKQTLQNFVELLECLNGYFCMLTKTLSFYERTNCWIPYLHFERSRPPPLTFPFFLFLIFLSSLVGKAILLSSSSREEMCVCEYPSPFSWGPEWSFSFFLVYFVPCQFPDKD